MARQHWAGPTPPIYWERRMGKLVRALGMTEALWGELEPPGRPRQATSPPLVPGAWPGTGGTSTHLDRLTFSEEDPVAEEDIAVVEAVRSGDTEAFRTLVERHKRRLYAVIPSRDGTGRQWGRTSRATNFPFSAIPCFIYGPFGGFFLDASRFVAPMHAGYGPGDGTGNNGSGPGDGTGYGPGPRIRP